MARRRALSRTPRPAVDRRQRLQGRRRQRAPGARGGVRRLRPRQERLPACRRDRAARGRDPAARARQGGRQEDHRPPQAGPGDRRAGRQGPAEDEGRPPLDGVDHRRALHGLRPDGRGHRRLEAARRQGTRAAAQGGEGARPRRRRRDRAHRGAGGQARGLRARDALPPQALRGAREARPGRQGAGHGLPGGRPVGARRARHLLGRLREGDRRRREAAPAAELVLHPHRARSWSTRSSCTPTPTRRCSRSSASTR